MGLSERTEDMGAATIGVVALAWWLGVEIPGTSPFASVLTFVVWILILVGCWIATWRGA